MAHTPKTRLFSEITSRLIVVACLAMLSACAGVPPAEHLDKETLNDPLEGFNRGMYKFNSKADQYVLKPVSNGYRKVLPNPIRRGINNFFRNLGELGNIVNAALQGKGDTAAASTARFMANSTFGLFGFFDVATKLDVQRHEEDFGQTFAVWGFGPGPYIVLPFLGPSSVRDGIGLLPDYFGFHPISRIDDTPTRIGLIALRAIDARSQLGAAERVLATQLDPYLFLRESYQQARINDIYDGDPPRREDEDADEFDEFFDDVEEP